MNVSRAVRRVAPFALIALSAAVASAGTVIESEADGQAKNDTPGTAEVLDASFFTTGQPDAFGGGGTEDGVSDLLTASISGRNGGNDVDFFQFTLTQLGELWFDIDGAQFDTIVAVFDASGTLIAYNDDTLGNGDGDGANSFLGLLTLGSGTYYVAISQYPNFPTQYYGNNLFMPVLDDPRTSFIDNGTLVFFAPPDPSYGGGNNSNTGGNENLLFANVQLGSTYTLHITGNAFAPAATLVTPEPGTYALFGLGLAGFAGAAWRRRRRSAV